MDTLHARFPTMNFDTIDPRFMHPFTAIIAEPSSSGKSMFCMRLIRNARECIAPPPERIVYCYSVYQPIFDQFPNVEFVEGLPDLNMFDGVKRTLLIIDDLMHETNDTVAKLFTRVSHHKNVSVVYLTQNLFNNNKHNRTISLNAHYMILFKNVRGRNPSTLSCPPNVSKEFRGYDARIQGCNRKTLRLFTRRFDAIYGWPLPSKNENISRGDWRDVCPDINTDAHFSRQLHSANMAHRVHNCQKAIEALEKVKDCKQKRNHIIDVAGKELVHCICDCVLNVLNGNIPVNEEEKQRLETA